MDVDYEKLIRNFERNTHETLSEGMSKYMRFHFPFYGIQQPLRKQIQQPFIKSSKSFGVDSIISVSKRLWEKEERECQYTAIDLIIAHKNNMEITHVGHIKSLILSKSWWDTVDILGSGVIGFLVKKYPTPLKRLMIEWSESDHLWLQRTALIHQLRYKENTDTELMEIILQNTMSNEDFFIQKAIGWSLRQYAYTDPTYVKKVVETYAIKGLAKNEALKKMPLLPNR
jgi:3-methyladenine DNA glycosylase AlkD